VRRFVSSLCGTIGLVVLSACGHAAPRPEPAVAAPTAAPIGGMPATDHTWEATDFQAAVAEFSALQARQLPRLTNRQTAAVFESLTDPATVAPCTDQSIPLASRMSECLDLQQAANQILRFYAEAMQADVSYSEETIRLLGFGLRTAAAMTALMDEFVPTLDPADPTYPTRMQGLAQARHGATELVQGSLSTLTTDRWAYSDDAAALFARILAETYPTLTRSAPAATTAEFIEQLAQIARDDRSAAVREALAQYANTQ
jgi:hypothetical protein